MVTAEEKKVLWQREEIPSVKLVSLDTGREISGTKILEDMFGDIKCISDNCIYFENFLCVDGSKFIKNKEMYQIHIVR